MEKEEIIKMIIKEKLEYFKEKFGVENCFIQESKIQSDIKTYRVVIYYPYYIKSNWVLTDFSNTKDLLNRAINLVYSSLNTRHKSIMDRNKINQIKLKKFKSYFKNPKEELKDYIDNKISEVDKKKECEILEEAFELAYSNGLFHQTKLANIPTEVIWNDLYSKDSENEEYVSRNPELTLKEFVELMLKEECHYCGITMKKIYDLGKERKLFTKRARGYSMEIDQKNPNGGYTEDNCVTACYWCNNAKTDEFSYEEFKEIAEGFKVVWHNRLANIKEK